jgi:hypothetical protein
MIELTEDTLCFSFAEVHPGARLRVEFQRTLRIPDDDRDYPLPPGLGCFPLRHTDDFASRVPRHWLEHGGVMLPMYQAEALWLNLTGEDLEDRDSSYPFAIRVATGKVDAVTGKAWVNGLEDDPQNYLVSPTQPWLDGYCVQRGVIRQFVAMPLGRGYSVEEQVTGKAEHGGIQIQVFPMKREAFERRFPVHSRDRRTFDRMVFSKELQCGSPSAAMGLAPGGRMRQEIYEDPFGLEDWDLTRTSRCFVHLVNSAMWKAMTGELPPTTPPSAADYSRAGLPWFDYYDESAKPADGSAVLRGLKSVFRLGEEKGDHPPAENEGASAPRVVNLRRGLRPGQVREGAF